MVTLLRKDADNEDGVENFQLITLLNTEFRILTKVLAKTLELVIASLVGEAQTWPILTRSINNNCQRMQYIVKGAGTKAGFTEDLANLDK